MDLYFKVHTQIISINMLHLFYRSCFYLLIGSIPDPISAMFNRDINESVNFNYLIAGQRKSQLGKWLE